MPDGPVAFFLLGPDDQELTRVLHDYFRASGRPDLCARVLSVTIGEGDVLALGLDRGGYADDDKPIVRFGMGLVAERYAELRGRTRSATIPLYAGRYDLEELLRQRRAENPDGDG